MTELDPKQLKQGKPEEKQTHLRILVCHVCKSVEEVPDFDGPAEYDQLLEYVASQHEFESGNRHLGNLFRVPEKDWKNPEFREAAISQIEQARADKEGKNVGLGEVLYDLRNNFAQDALVCWKAHNRTTDCDEYRTDRKALLADTRADRKAAGLDTSVAARPKHWLCDYCPVHSVVQQKARAKAKMYDKQEWE